MRRVGWRLASTACIGMYRWFIVQPRKNAKNTEIQSTRFVICSQHNMSNVSLFDPDSDHDSDSLPHPVNCVNPLNPVKRSLTV